MAKKKAESNTRRRTRKALLDAAGRLMKAGKVGITLEEVAGEAMVSRAAAYRYFPSVEALCVEAGIHVAFPGADDVLARAGEDPLERVLRVDGALDEMMRENEMALRRMLASSMERVIRGEASDEEPVRQNRRVPLIRAALGPVAGKVKPGTMEVLEKALAMVVGTEGMVVTKDVLQLKDAEARKVKGWAIRMLVEGAIAGGEEVGAALRWL